MIQKKLITLILSLVIAFNAYADDINNSSLVESNSVIQGLDAALQDIKKQSPILVLFPKDVPAPSAEVYVSYSSFSVKPDYKQFWQISIDTTPECKGLRTCNLGAISAEKGRTIETKYENLPENILLTKEKVSLKNGTMAYYMPPHPETNRMNGTLEWLSKGVLYTLRWKIDGDDPKSTLVEMANSVF